MLRSCFAPRPIVAALIISLVAGLAAPSSAAIGVTPLSAILPAGATAASFTVTNPENVARVVQPQVFRWAHVNGQDELTKTTDWVVNPPVASIPPLGTRVIRMALRHRVATTEEMTYRMELAEVNAPRETGVAVSFSAKLLLPIFLEPAFTSKRKPDWSAVRNARQIAVTLKNTSQVHVHVSRFVLRDPSGKTLQFDTPSYVFSGETRTWTLVLDKSVADPRLLVVEAGTDDGVKTIPIGDRQP